MPRRNNKASNLSLLADWSMVIARFIVDHSSQPGIDEQLFDVILSAGQRGDVRGLKMIARDMTEWGRTLTDEQRDQLDRELLGRFSVGLERGVLDVDEQLRRILVDRVLRDENDYRVALHRVESIHADPASAAETATLNEALAEYHMRPLGNDE